MCGSCPPIGATSKAAHAREFQLDTTKIASYGTSAGGQLAALLGTTSGSEIVSRVKMP